jgi:hypothetical protein
MNRSVFAGEPRSSAGARLAELVVALLVALLLELAEAGAWAAPQLVM